MIPFVSYCQSKKNLPEYGCLDFQNYRKETMILPDDVIQMLNENIYWDPCLFQINKIFNNSENEEKFFLKYFLENKKFACLDSKEITDTQLNFLLKQKVINHYLDNSYYPQPEDTMKKYYVFWYLGEVDLNSNYKSYLILKRDRDSSGYFRSCTLFLLNVRTTQLLSITRAADYSIFAGHGGFQYLKMEKNKTFSYRNIFYGSEIYPKRIERKMNRHKKEICEKFTFDDSGFVKILSKKNEFYRNAYDEENPWRPSLETADYPGGMEEYLVFIKKKFVYPKEAKEKGIEGTVTIQFDIEENGTISNVKALSQSVKIGYGCEEEAIRVISIMPKWKPQKENGKTVKVSYVTDVRFSLKDE